MPIKRTFFLAFCLWASLCPPAHAKDVRFYAPLSVKEAPNNLNYIQTITTEASVTPTAYHAVVKTGFNAIRIWTGHQDVAEPYFDLYIKRSSTGLTSQVRLYRYTGRIFNVSPGESLSFGTSDGRAIQYSLMTVPATLVDPSGSTGTARCDKAGPSGEAELWNPTAGHMVLPSKNSEFTLKSDGTERVIFFREHDGMSWTPITFVRLPASTDIKVRATYKKIACAEYGGTSVGIVAPLGTAIGGVSTTMSFGIKATGVTHSVSAGDESDFRVKLALAVAGDEVVLPAGTYTLTTAVSALTFAANAAAGYLGGEGIIIRGATGNRADVVLVPADSSSSFTFLQTGAVHPILFKDLSVDFTAKPLASGLTVRNGVARLENVAIRGGASGDNFNGLQNGGTLNLRVLFSDASDCTADCWNMDGDNTEDSARSVVQFVGSTGRTAGPNSNNQILTTHDSLNAELWGGLYSDAHSSVVANGGAVDPRNYIFFSNFTDGPRAAGLSDSSMFFCSRTTSTVIGSQINGYAGAYFIGNHETHAAFTNTSPAYRESTTTNGSVFIANLFNLVKGKAFQTSFGGSNVTFNIVTAADSAGANSAGIHTAAYVSGSTAEIIYHNNTVTGTARAIRIADGNLPVDMRNNACYSNGISISLENTADSGDAIGSYNVLDPTVSAAYAVGTNDMIAVDAAMDANYFPIASGNSDLTGDGSLYSWVGGIDPFGFVAIYKQGSVSRGARTRPVIYPGAELFPELRV